jgi:predicted phage terminase large subunit-like protein
MNKNNREKVIDWYTKTVTQRFQENTTVIIIQTRWHELDLSGYLLKYGTEKWESLRIPAIAEENDPIGRKVGKPLMESKGLKFLEARKKDMGSMSFAAVYQQSPQAQKGNIFLREYWQRYTIDAKPQTFTRIITSWDTAFETKKESAYSACTIWGQTEDRFYLLGMWRKKADYPTVKNKIIEIQRKFKAAICLLEDKASGKSLRQELSGKTGGLSTGVTPVTPISDKLTRAYSVTSLFENGQVFIVKGEEWADEIIDGCAAYPVGDFGDVVDTISQALAWMASGTTITEEELDILLENTDGHGAQVRGGNYTLRTPNLLSRSVFKFGT